MLQPNPTTASVPTTASASSTSMPVSTESATPALPPAAPQVHPDDLNHALWLMYASHALNQFSEWSWQFCLVLLLAALSNYDLLLVSTYGIVVGLATTTILPYTGILIDGYARKGQRLRLAQVWISCENMFVVLATAGCWYLLRRHDANGGGVGDVGDVHDDGSDGYNNQSITHEEEQDGSSFAPRWSFEEIVCLAVVHICGAIAQVLDRSFLVAVEKDWIVAMSTCVVEPTRDGPIMPTQSTNDVTNQPATLPHSRPPPKASSLWLSKTNVQMKQIDLACKVMAPTFAGWFLAMWTITPSPDAAHDTTSANSQAQRPHGSSDLSPAILWISGWNVAALVIELICIARIHSLIPVLAAPIHPQQSGDNDNDIDDVDDSDSDTALESEYLTNTTPEPGSNEEAASASTSASTSSKHGSNVSNNKALVAGAPECNLAKQKEGASTSTSSTASTSVLSSIKLYLRQGAATYGGIGLALLHLNTLTFSGLMTAYLIAQGMTLDKIGVLRGVSNAVGLLGTLAYRSSTEMCGWSLEFTGFWSIVWEITCLSISASSVFFGDSTALLVAGVLPSRLGLWVFDIAIVQMMQEQVPVDIRGRVGGVQSSMECMFGFFPFCLGLMFSKPEQYSVFVWTGYTAVAIAAFVYSCGVYLPFREEEMAGLGRFRVELVPMTDLEDQSESTPCPPSPTSPTPTTTLLPSK